MKKYEAIKERVKEKRGRVTEKKRNRNKTKGIRQEMTEGKKVGERIGEWKKGGKERGKKENRI